VEADPRIEHSGDVLEDAAVGVRAGNVQSVPEVGDEADLRCTANVGVPQPGAAIPPHAHAVRAEAGDHHLLSGPSPVPDLKSDIGPSASRTPPQFEIANRGESGIRIELDAANAFGELDLAAPRNRHACGATVNLNGAIEYQALIGSVPLAAEVDLPTAYAESVIRLHDGRVIIGGTVCHRAKIQRGDTIGIAPSWAGHGHAQLLGCGAGVVRCHALHFRLDGFDAGRHVGHGSELVLRRIQAVGIVLGDTDVNAIVRDTLGVIPEGARLGAERFGRGGDDVPNVVHATPVVLTVVRVVRISPVWWDDTVRHDYLWVT